MVHISQIFKIHRGWTRMARAPTLRELMNSVESIFTALVGIWTRPRSIISLPVTLSLHSWAILKMHLIFPMFSKYCELTQINPEYIHGHSQNIWRIYFGLIHIFPIKFSEIFSKVHSFIHIICIICFSHDFSKDFHFMESIFSRNYDDFRSWIFPNQIFSMIFLKILFS